MKEIFDFCVELLILVAKMTSTTYIQINVIIFCILEPVVFLLMAYIIYKQWKKIKLLRSNKF
jgi:hypothetical protein